VCLAWPRPVVIRRSPAMTPPARLIHAGRLTAGVGQPRLRVAVDGHLVVICEVAEEGVPRLADVEGTLDKVIRIHMGLADLALGPVAAEVPVVSDGFRCPSPWPAA
jgi:hypothetical protein